METERIDTRSLEPAAREQLRRTVIRLHNRGRKQTDIAKEPGLRRPTVNKWINTAKAGESVKEKKRGRALGDGRQLTSAQEERIRCDIVDKTPDQMKLPFALWNARAVQALIKDSFGHTMPIRSVRRHLKRWGFTPQRPLKRALEQKPEAVQKWLSDKTDRIELFFLPSDSPELNPEEF